MNMIATNYFSSQEQLHVGLLIEANQPIHSITTTNKISRNNTVVKILIRADWIIRRQACSLLSAINVTKTTIAYIETTKINK